MAEKMPSMYVERFIYQTNQQATALKVRRLSPYGCMDNAFSTAERQTVLTSVLFGESKVGKKPISSLRKASN